MDSQYPEDQDKVEVVFYVNFRNQLYNQLIRKKQFDEIDFISYCGGLLGLLTGFSLLSAFELIYWMILKIFTKLGNSSTRVYPMKKEEKKEKLLLEFLENSSVHGVNYFTKENKIER